MYRRIGIMCLLLSTLAVSGAWGEEDTDTPKTLEPVIVTATKTEEHRQDIPNPVIVKDSADIEESTATGVGDLLAGEAGVDWRTRGDYGGAAQEIHLRGMAGDEVQVLMNGVSINSPSLGTADVGGIPLNNIERIEVVKGSGSLLYGSGAMGGTVNVITKRPDKERMALNATAGYGSDSTYKLAADHGMYVSESVGYYISATRVETDGQRENGKLTHNDASLKLIYDRGKILDVSLYGDYIARKFGRPGIDPPDTASPAELYLRGVKFYDTESASLLDKGETKNGHVVLDIKSSPLNWLGIGFKGYYTDMRSIDTQVNNADSWSGGLAGEGMKTWIDNAITGAEANFQLKPMSGASLLLGGDIKEHDYHARQLDLNINGRPASGLTGNKAEIGTRGMYAEAQYRPHRVVKFLAGIRQENHSTFGTENLPLYGLVLNPFEETTLKVTHGKHFRAPTPNDLFWPEDDFARGNPDLKPQTGWHTDVTLEQSVAAQGLQFSASYFNWYVKDKINWAENPNFPGPFGNKWTPSNVDKSFGLGWEASVSYEPVYAWNLNLSFTHVNVEEKTPTLRRSAQYVAENQAKAAVKYRSSIGLTATATVRYVGDRPFYASAADAAPTDILKTYTTADLKLAQRVRENWVLAVEGLNLFDADYDTYEGSFVDGSGNQLYGPFPGAGRSVFASVTYQY